jgi:hypothetical protein
VIRDGDRCCLECRHWHALKVDEADELELRSDSAGVHVPMPAIGECRARPPQPFMLATQASRLDGRTGVEVKFPAAWPQTQPLAWCGNFTPKGDNG